MVSIGKLAAGQASYYLDQAHARVDRATSVGTGVEDYYVGGTEAPGYWIGSGSSRLGARGTVAANGLRNVLDGRLPDGSGELVAARSRRVPGFDVTFSAPKSVSVMFGLGDDRLRRAIRVAHDEAVADAFAYLERVAARGRRKHGGAITVEGHGLIAAAFRHRTSRAGDPQLHTHVLVANVLEGVDGKWSALDGRGVYQHGKTAGYLYEAALRARLTERLGVEWGPVRDGVADVAGVPAEVLRAFSRRRAEVEAELERRGETSAAAARMATLATRRRKDYGVVPEDLVAEWRDRAAALGFDRQALRGVLERQRRPVAEWQRVHTRLASSDGLTHSRATFARRDVVQAVCETAPAASASAAEIEEQADAFLGSHLAVPIVDADGAERLPTIRRRDGRLVYGRQNEGRYSTPEHLAIEGDIVDTAVAGLGRGVAVADERAVQRALRRPLSREQDAMVRRLTQDGDQVAVVLGQAGAGKTYALRAAHAAWRASGLDVRGAAISLRAARELEQGSGIPSTSIASLLHRLRVGSEPLPPGVVVVVDEAGMLPTRELDELLRRVVDADGKLVLTGDHRQLPELEAGGSFRGLVYRLPTIVLEENRRQRARWERAALKELRHGDVPAALRAYRKHGRVIVAPDADAVRRQVVSDFLAAGAAPEAIMIALRRRDVRELNRLARNALVELGVVSGPELTIGGEQFAAGDVVLLRRNDRLLGIANGDRGTVERIEERVLVVNLGEAEVRVEPDYYVGTAAHGDAVVAHGYAFTGHVAQGLTVREALVLATDEMYREWAYTALSRGTHSNRLYVVGSEPRVRDEIAPAARRASEEALVSALRTSRRQAMALDSGRPLDAEVRERLVAIAEERKTLAALLGRAQPTHRWRRRGATAQRERRELERRQDELRAQEEELWRSVDAATPTDGHLQRDMSKRLGREASR